MPRETHLSLSLDGLTCASCVARAERAVLALPGVKSASVSLATQMAQLELEGGSVKSITDALSAAGYPPRTRDIVMDVDGMTCAGCAASLEKALTGCPGVVSVSVNFATQTAHLTCLDPGTQVPDIKAAAAQVGYTLSETGGAAEPAETRAGAELARSGRLALLAVVLALPVFLLEMGGHLVPALHHAIGRTIGHETSWTIQFLLTSAVLFGPGMVFFRKGVPALLRGAPDMNSLVALGTAAAWGFSTVALFAPSLLPQGARAVYFEAAAVIVALILIGRWLEARARGQTGAAIRRLIGLQPRTARADRDGTFLDVAISDLVAGDLLQLRPGERIAVDGTVIDGQSFIDESMITGEPVPTSKQAGDWVVAGTVNGSGVLHYRAEKVGSDTMLAQIIAMVQQAQGAKLPIQALADKVVQIFVPVVMTVAALTVAVWLLLGPDPALGFALVAGVSVLIIACPCAMGLATPTSIMVGTGRAAEMGVLFRKGDALQALGSVRMLAFDKTGTLTLGRPTVTDFEVTGGWAGSDLMSLIAAAEAQSEHPIARAITDGAEERGVSVPEASQVTALDGLGLRASVAGRDLLIGSRRLMTQQQISCDVFAQRYEALQEEGKTPVLAAVDGAVMAVIGVSDPIKPRAQQALAALRAEGVAIAMITGDAAGTARVVAARLGIAHVEAEVMPGEKRDAVQRLREEHGSIGFVGDGINDAPALAEADVGLAIGSGTDVAIESADVVLVSGDLAGAVNALHMSRATLRNIRQNLFWAFAYNAALIPVAAGVLYPAFGVLLSPMLAAGAMALSSVFVLFNALRLRSEKPALRDSPAGPMMTPGTQKVAAG